MRQAGKCSKSNIYSEAMSWLDDAWHSDGNRRYYENDPNNVSSMSFIDMSAEGNAYFQRRTGGYRSIILTTLTFDTDDGGNTIRRCTGRLGPVR